MAKRPRGRWDKPPAGDTLPLHLESLTHQGATLARRDGQVVFAAYGVPGEDADVLIERVYPDYLEGRVVGVHNPSPDRVEPRCVHFGECGGCQLQHIRYERQLELKRDIVIEQLRRIGRLTDVDVRPTLASPEPWAYRNHARFSVNREGQLGFTMRGRKRVIPLQECHIVHPWIRGTFLALQGRARGLRQVAMRVGVHTGETLIQPPLDAVAPETPSGQRRYDEELLGERFHVSAASFFQVNTRQAENLIRLVRDGLALGPDDVLLDAYAGVGTFAKTLADTVREVVAIEVSASSVADGKENTAEKLNITWLLGEVEALLPTMTARPTAAVLDPSRQGCGLPTLEALIRAETPRLAYVSCEPATLARDLRILVEGGYQIAQVQPVDMFPHTYHIESVTILRR